MIRHINTFIGTCRSKGTKKNYERAIRRYLQYIYEDRESDPEDLADQYLKDKRNYRNDMISFIDHLEEKYAPKTINVFVSGVKEFLLSNDIELSMADQRQIKRRKPKQTNITHDKPITINILHRIIDHMRTKQGKALVSFIASSGCRIGEALSISVDDVDLTMDPARVYLRGSYTKNQENRTTFISDEAKKNVVGWLKDRQKELDDRKRKYNKFDVNTEDDRLFPMTYQNAYALWSTALSRAGLDTEKDKNRNMYTYHGLRRFFKTQLTGFIPSEIIERMIGHEGYLNGSYYRVSDDEMAKQYRQHMDRLETKSLDNTIDRMEIMEQRIDKMQKENQWLKNYLVSVHAHPDIDGDGYILPDDYIKDNMTYDPINNNLKLKKNGMSWEEYRRQQMIKEIREYEEINDIQ